MKEGELVSFSGKFFSSSAPIACVLSDESGLSAHIGGEYGGLGADIQDWRAKGSLGTKF